MATSTTTPTVERLAPNVYRVPSRSNGLDHIVTMMSFGPVCSCEAKTHGKTCWAARIIAEYHPRIVQAEQAERIAAMTDDQLFAV